MTKIAKNCLNVSCRCHTGDPVLTPFPIDPGQRDLIEALREVYCCSRCNPARRLFMNLVMPEAVHD